LSGEKRASRRQTYDYLGEGADAAMGVLESAHMTLSVVK
jgi:hypothetical protein